MFNLRRSLFIALVSIVVFVLSFIQLWRPYSHKMQLIIRIDDQRNEGETEKYCSLSKCIECQSELWEFHRSEQ